MLRVNIILQTVVKFNGFKQLKNKRTLIITIVLQIQQNIDSNTENRIKYICIIKVQKKGERKK